jgi:two-component sensor histidine kinase
MSVSDFPPSRARRPLALFALQAAIWAALTFAFAALLVLVSPLSWSDALGISAVNWIPWVALTPLIFWVARRFPLERGRLLRSVPVHVVASLVCVSISLTVTTLVFNPGRGDFGGGFRGSGRRPPEWRQRSESGAPGEMRPPFPRKDDSLPADFRGPRPRPGDAKGPGPYPRGEFRNDFRGGPGGPGGFSRGGGPPPESTRNPLFAFIAPLAVRGNFDLAIYLIVITAAHALAYYRRAEDRDRQALALTAGLNQARLDALRLQLQPHFLFNTLNAISTLVHRDPDAADELISDLSDLLRASLENKDHEVPLAREIELLDRYLAIEQTRLGSRLRIVRDIDPAATAALVPTFLLQPLAENAIRHGLEPRAAPGTLTISARREGAELRLAVTDDGVGLGVKAARTARHGIGLSNSEERLRTLHNGRARLELISPPEGGVRVEVVLPFCTERSVVGAVAPA